MTNRRLAHACVGVLAALTLLWYSFALPQAVVAVVPHSTEHTRPIKRSLAYNDLSDDLRAWLKSQGISTPDSFARYIHEIDRKTTAREIDGEYDHLIFFLLQSERFTAEARIEPALSAEQFVRSLNPSESARYLAEGSDYVPTVALPKQVQSRTADFIRALTRPLSDERLAYFQALINRTTNSGDSLVEKLRIEYARAMRFLYQKEFASQRINSPEESAAYVASLYQDRGHSTDTQLEANFGLQTALSVIRAQTPEQRLSNVLIVGPGLDFAPRTDLMDLVGPQSYQPFAVADALLALKLAEIGKLRIHCVDINDRVVGYLQRLSARGEIRLSLVSGVGDTASRTMSEDYKDYFRGLGTSIGSVGPLDLPAGLARRLRKTVLVRPEIGERISAERFNVITQRYVPSPSYDLVIVTNVFPYFNRTELMLSLANIAAMMKEGGYLIHNELQTVPGSFTASAGLPLEHARTVLIAGAKDAPLFDGVAIHRKANR